MSRGFSVAYTTPKESYSKKSSVYIAKQSNSRPTKKNRKSNKDQAFKTYNDYVSNLLDSTTNPDLPTLGKRVWSFIKSMGISPLKQNGKGKAVHDSRKKADLLLEQINTVFLLFPPGSLARTKDHLPHFCFL